MSFGSRRISSANHPVSNLSRKESITCSSVEDLYESLKQNATGVASILQNNKNWL
jgi:hypothetical protein